MHVFRARQVERFSVHRVRAKKLFESFALGSSYGVEVPGSVLKLIVEK
jgi:hypothetical protein